MPLNFYLIYFPIYKIKENKEMSVKWFESPSKKALWNTWWLSFKESGRYSGYWEYILNHVSGHDGNFVNVILLSSIPEGQLDKDDIKVQY